MTRLLPALHEGHAPINLHYAFDDAIEAFEAWTPGTPEPEVEFDGKNVPISSVFGRMRTCSDLLPQRTLDLACEVIGERPGAELSDDATYSAVAFVLRAMCVDRLARRAA